MTLRRAVGAAILTAVCAAPLQAGQSAVTPSTDTLPLVADLERIKTALRAEEPIGLGGLRFSEYAEVHGRAPAFDPLWNVDLNSEAVRYGSPTHDEMVALMTPRNFRTRGMNVAGVVQQFARWLRGRRVSD
jgi:hypothetical protein